MQIREAQDADFAAIWPIFKQIAAAGDTYAYSPDIGEQEARASLDGTASQKPLWLSRAAGF